MRRSAWTPERSGVLALSGSAIEELAGEATDLWASAPDPERVVVLDRLLQRIPRQLEEVVRRCVLAGESQASVAHDLDLHQPYVAYLVGHAQERLRLVAGLGVDLVPSEVEARLLRARESPAVAVLVSTYWREHTIAAARREAGMGVTDGRCRLLYGAWRRHASLHEVARAVDAINGWQGVRPGRRRAGDPPIDLASSGGPDDE